MTCWSFRKHSENGKVPRHPYPHTPEPPLIIYLIIKKNKSAKLLTQALRRLSPYFMLELQIFSHDRSIHQSISGISAYYLPPENEPCLKFTWDSSGGEKRWKYLALNYSPGKTYSEERWNPKTTRRGKLELGKYKIIAKVKHKREAGFGYQIKSIKVSLSPGFSFLSPFFPATMSRCRIEKNKNWCPGTLEMNTRQDEGTTTTMAEAEVQKGRWKRKTYKKQTVPLKWW